MTATKLDLQIPKFDATDHISGKEEEFQKELNKAGGNKFIKDPGEYILTVQDIENKGIAKSDANWLNLRFKLETANGESFNLFQLFPLKRVDNFKYGPKKTLFVYRGLMDFLRAFGVTLEFDTAMATIGGLLGNMEAFIGKKIRVEIGYTGPHTQYIGKDGDKNQYVIINKGERLKDEEGVEMIFPDWKAAENYAAGVSLKLQGFPEILKFYDGDSLTVSEVEETEEDYSDIPL